MRKNDYICKMNVKRFYEGVGDKYLQNNYYFTPQFDEFDKKYKSMKATEDNIEIVHTNEDWKLYKNPKSLDHISKSARGVITLDGDLYIESHSKGTIHNDILKILYDKEILKGEITKNWGKKLPQESGFLTVQRYKDSKYVAIGESNKDIYDEDDWNERVKYYDEVLDKARKNNPRITFTNKLVGFKFYGLKSMTDEHSNILYENKLNHLIKNFV